MFAIGLPGQAPRILLNTTSAEQAERKLRAGEVVVEVAAPAAYLIDDEGVSVRPYEPNLDEQKYEKLAALSSLAEVLLNYWATPDGGLQVDDLSTGRLNAWATMALVSKTTGAAFELPYWVMGDNSHRPFEDADDFLAFATAAANYKTAAVLRNSTLKAAIRDAGNEADLAAVDIFAGWPD